MTRLGRLDHIVIAGPDLGVLVDWFAERTGVRASFGGRHPTGTANALVALTRDGRRVPQHLELIGPDPERDDPELPAKFGIDLLEAPAVVTYAVRPDDLDAAVAGARSRGFEAGELQPLSRRTPDGTLLEWRLVRRSDRHHELPFLIDWGSTPQPGLGDLPTLELLDFARVEPQPAALESELERFGLGVDAAPVRRGGESRFALALGTAEGARVEL